MSDNEFWMFPDHYRFAKQHSLQHQNKTADEYYLAAMDFIRKNLTFGEPKFQEFFTNYLAMWNFARFGYPYIKIYPAMALMLARTRIDIPSEHLKIPLPVFQIRFSKSPRHALRESLTSPAVRSILLAHDLSHVPEALDFFPPQYRTLGITALAPEGEIFMFADFGEVFDNGPAYERLFITLHEGETVQDAFIHATPNQSGRDLPGYHPSEEFRRSLLSVAIAACFFMCHNHEYVAPDIHPRLIERYRKAKNAKSGKEVEQTSKQSRKLGYNGSTIGREIELPEPIVRYIDEQDQSGGGKSWEMKWSHVRSGHMRHQPFGPRIEGKHKLIFIAPMLVRADLPTSPSQKGYRIEDRPLGEASGGG